MLLLSFVFGCYLKTPQKMEHPMMVLHNDVTKAVEISGDAEMADWVEFEDDYIVRHVPDDSLAHHDRFRVETTVTSHPMSFEMVRHRTSGVVMVTSNHVMAIQKILQQEAELIASSSVYETVKNLFAAAPAKTVVVRKPEQLQQATSTIDPQSFSSPNIEYGVDGIVLEMIVINDIGQVQRWLFDLPWKGTAQFIASNLASVERTK
ncbi:MAG: hypothetical protein VX278_14260 [Myxococcota bacterium]|nr:hypothetical protein [Myxococcota bacterium]